MGYTMGLTRAALFQPCMRTAGCNGFKPGGEDPEEQTLMNKGGDDPCFRKSAGQLLQVESEYVRILCPNGRGLLIFLYFPIGQFINWEICVF